LEVGKPSNSAFDMTHFGLTALASTTTAPPKTQVKTLLGKY